MIRLLRSSERRYLRGGDQEQWLTFGGADGWTGRIAALTTFDEWRLLAGAAIRRQHPAAGDILTYVRQGTLAYTSLECRGVVQAGEFQRRTAARRSRYRESNGSHTDSAQLFQIGLRGSVPSSGSDVGPAQETKRFSVAERRDRLRVIASPDGRHDSLRLHHDALLYSAILYGGQHVVHELPAGRGLWLHVVEGEVALGDAVLTAGDGAGVMAELAVSLTARAAGEILLLDLATAPRRERGRRSRR